ncbi:MAG TPA: class II fructose-bisphosphatase [Actinomycetota bacterium]|nr:class II fructose-bisphosphatase [Actinomycetota bacterium]
MTPAKPDRNLALELVRVTEAAALAAAHWMGRGDKNAADAAAVDAMRLMLNSVAIDGVVVIGEGEKDEAPMLYNGEKVGTGEMPQVDIAVDPIDGTTLLSRGQANSIAVIAVSERGTMLDPGPCVYMEKVATGPEARDAIDIEKPIEDNIKAVAKAKGLDVNEVTVAMLDRPRHDDFVTRARAIGARVRLFSDGDIATAIAAGRGFLGIDLLYGIGGTPEGVTAAAALTCIGGSIQGRLWPRNDDERALAVEQGFDVDKPLTTKDLCSGEDIFFSATGITDGFLLEGVRYGKDRITTQTMIMRSRSGTLRTVIGEHDANKLRAISAEEPWRRH